MHSLARGVSRTLLMAVTAFTVGGNCWCDPADTATDKKLSEIRRRAEAGFVDQQIELAGAYLAGRGVPQDAAMAARWYERAAQSGDPFAENEIGYFYQVGIGVPVNLERAAHWFQLASSSGWSWAKINLGVSYLRGLGVPKDPAAAKHLFLEAVDKGAGLGATYLGIMNLYGVGVPQDKAAAEHWFEVGVKLHDAEAAYDLGCLFSVTEDHAKDLRKAAELLRLSAGRGYVPAKHSLGMLLVNHPELAQPNEQALPLLLEASGAGNWRSSVLLGVLARDGKNTSADPRQAFYYFNLAGLQGGDLCRKLVAPDMNALRTRLSLDEQKLQEANASAWFQQHPTPQTFVFKQGAGDRDFPPMAVAEIAPEQ